MRHVVQIGARVDGPAAGRVGMAMRLVQLRSRCFAIRKRDNLQGRDFQHSSKQQNRFVKIERAYLCGGRRHYVRGS